MINKKNIPLQLEKIKTIFQNTTEFCTQVEDLNLIKVYLKNSDSEFRSIAYEGASMTIALKDFEKGFQLKQWNIFINELGLNHSGQIHVGLGWAIARKNYSPLLFLETIHPLVHYFLLNGYGYYDGIFKQRQTIKNKKIPETFQGILLEGYDQGIGRSLWYIFKGEEKKIAETIKNFAPLRHKALWRGIGIASTYVGGCDENQLKSILLCAGEHHAQLALGAILVTRSRIKANTLTSDAKLACRVWCNLSTEEALSLTVRSEPDFSLDPDNAYEIWISKMIIELTVIDANKQLILK